MKNEMRTHSKHESSYTTMQKRRQIWRV